MVFDDSLGQFPRRIVRHNKRFRRHCAPQRLNGFPVKHFVRVGLSLVGNAEAHDVRFRGHTARHHRQNDECPSGQTSPQRRPKTLSYHG